MTRLNNPQHGGSVGIFHRHSLIIQFHVVVVVVTFSRATKIKNGFYTPPITTLLLSKMTAASERSIITSTNS
jgi:hypothetical protein